MFRNDYYIRVFRVVSYFFLLICICLMGLYLLSGKLTNGIFQELSLFFGAPIALLVVSIIARYCYCRIIVDGMNYRDVELQEFIMLKGTHYSIEKAVEIIDSVAKQFGKKIRLQGMVFSYEVNGKKYRGTQLFWNKCEARSLLGKKIQIAVSSKNPKMFCVIWKSLLL